MATNDLKILTILSKLEEYRKKLDDGTLTPGCPDHTVRYCEAIVAEYGPYENRAAWIEDLKKEGFINEN